MSVELVSIPSTDGYLDGLFYRSKAQSIRGCVLLMHGNVANFYSGPSRFLPPLLDTAGYSCLAYNRRGHDVIVVESHSGASGGAFQTVAEAAADNNAAVKFLASRCESEAPLIVIGHSNGGMLATCFAVEHPEVSALVLLSAHAGGPESYWRSCANGLMAGAAAQEFLLKARSMVSEGRGKELLILPHWWYAISAESLVDRADNTPDVLANAVLVPCPVLTFRGSRESATAFPMERFAALVGKGSKAVVIEDGNHFYDGSENFVAESIIEWLEALASS
jgi:pimeloyl-ACP methyl ester carboxylesterase